MIKKSIMGYNTTIKTNTKLEGETIEQKIERIVNNKEPITDGAPLIYMERKQGIEPQYDVRTDRFDVAIDAMDIVAKSKVAKRSPVAEMKEGGVQGTEGNNPAA